LACPRELWEIKDSQIPTWASFAARELHNKKEPRAGGLETEKE